MKKNITLLISILMVVSMFATPLFDASGTVFAQGPIETPTEESTGPAVDLAALPIPTPYRPLGDTYTNRPTYSWSRKSNAISYRLAVYDVAAAKYILNITVGKAYCSIYTNRCSYKPNIKLVFGKNYKWRVFAKYASGNSAYSAFLNFKALAGFNSQFNGNSAGWVKRPGGAWKVSNAYYYTNGIANAWSSASFNKAYKNFTYQARLKRLDAGGSAAGGWASGLVVRGTPTFNSSNEWDTAYKFMYNNKGQFEIWKRVSGKDTPLTAWTPTSAIVRNDWNILKVTVDGSRMRFYINNKLVWSGSDSSISSGQVGVTMYRGDSTTYRLYVDWATLGMSEYYK